MTGSSYEWAELPDMTIHLQFYGQSLGQVKCLPSAAPTTKLQRLALKIFGLAAPKQYHVTMHIHVREVPDAVEVGQVVVNSEGAAFCITNISRVGKIVVVHSINPTVYPRFEFQCLWQGVFSTFK